MLRSLTWVGRFEGFSFIILLLIAMPLKYIWGQPDAVRVVGMAHGILFMVYIGLVFYVAIEEKWPLRLSLLGFVAAVLPCGTFVFERHLAKVMPQAKTSIAH